MTHSHNRLFSFVCCQLPGASYQLARGKHHHQTFFHPLHRLHKLLPTASLTVMNVLCLAIRAIWRFSSEGVFGVNEWFYSALGVKAPVYSVRHCFLLCLFRLMRSQWLHSLSMQFQSKLVVAYCLFQPLPLYGQVVKLIFSTSNGTNLSHLCSFAVRNMIRRPGFMIIY